MKKLMTNLRFSVLSGLMDGRWHTLDHMGTNYCSARGMCADGLLEQDPIARQIWRQRARFRITAAGEYAIKHFVPREAWLALEGHEKVTRKMHWRQFGEMPIVSPGRRVSSLHDQSGLPQGAGSIAGSATVLPPTRKSANSDHSNVH